MIFYDRRNNPGTCTTNVYHARSVDGGNTFDEQILTDAASSWSGIGYDRDFIWEGDYIRAVSVRNSVYAAWTDPRNGDGDRSQVHLAMLRHRDGFETPQVGTIRYTIKLTPAGNGSKLATLRVSIPR